MRMSTDAADDRVRRRALVLRNAVGGAAVLASYVLWLGPPSNPAGALWGRIEGVGRSLHTGSMRLAAVAYFAFFPCFVHHGASHPRVVPVFAPVWPPCFPR